MGEALTVSERTGLGIATVMARRGVDAAAIGAVLGCALPGGPGWRNGGDLSAIGTGPGTWLVMTETGSGDFAEDLTQRFRGLASVTDQSSAYAVFRLSGHDARTLLQRGVSIDLHPAAFAPGSAATSMISHIGVIFWQMDDAPTYEVAVFRSLAGSFRHWLDSVAATL
ncbi:MAG: sarcosine oxidase subunit gamma [Novosphingobium sp.]|nr:sarcosine oxidase subunit gamma [Novosphingobium sp.]